MIRKVNNILFTGQWLNFHSFNCHLSYLKRCMLYFNYQYAKSAFSTTCPKVNVKIDLALFPLERIRNFSIIAHIDHGKSTLADRILEISGAINSTSSNKQVLDKLQVERDRGITVKAQTASILHKYKDETYLLNLIDTPGHVDFSYEVSRSINTCQGVILLVDANQGVQAQTVANFFLAFGNNLKIIPVLNKIDLKNAQPELVKEQMLNIFEIDPDEVLQVSAKLGTGVSDVLDAVCERLPSPESNCKVQAPLRALMIDSWFHKFKGVMCQIAVVDGQIKVGDAITLFSTNKSYEVKSLSILTPHETPVDQIYTGQIGILSAKIHNPSEAQMGDTLYHKGKAVEPLTGFHKAKPMVFAGFYPAELSEQNNLQSAMQKLTLNDSSVEVDQETSEAFGLGWRLGFLGLLHMEVFSQRLQQEFDAQVVITTPSVPYKVTIKGAKNVKLYGTDSLTVHNPSKWPDAQHITEMFEPMVKATIISPNEYLSPIVSLCEERRGEQVDIQNLDNQRIIFTYKFPLSEVIVDFFDVLKSISSGFATFDYEDCGYNNTHLIKLGMKLNGRLIDELSTIVHHSKVDSTARHICVKLRDTLPKQLFKIAIQAVVGDKVIARENIKAVRKDVIAKCYGGDVTRKMKLLKRQAESKKKMKMIGNVEVPRETFINILKK